MSDRKARWADRVRAAELLLDRAFGRPQQHTEPNENGSPTMLRIEVINPDVQQTEVVTINAIDEVDK